MKVSAVFVEGYQDRAFVDGWLVANGTMRAEDAKRGVYVKQTTSGDKIFIIPTDGERKLVQRMTDFLAAQEADEVLIIQDADDLAPEVKRQRTMQSLATLRPSVAVYCWEPRLEAVIEEALRKHVPHRMTAVDQFVTARPDAPGASGKEHAYCAGWLSDFFGDAFYGEIARDPDLRAHLESGNRELFEHLRRLITPPS